MDKKYQVFISSTYKDLIEARAKVRDAILSMYYFPVADNQWNYWFFRGIYIIPMKKGEFKAKIELMCAEYEDPEKQNWSLYVNDNIL